LVNFKWSYHQKYMSNMTPHFFGNFWTTFEKWPWPSHFQGRAITCRPAREHERWFISWNSPNSGEKHHFSL